MLDATIYTRALNLAIENGRAAVAHGDHEKAEAFIMQFCHIVNYCDTHGLALDTARWPDAPGFLLKRNGYNPYALNILIDGCNGWNYRARKVSDSRYSEPWYETDEEVRLEALSQHWEERKNIERDYVERPW